MTSAQGDPPRGGSQQIPRPPNAEPTGPPPWYGVRAEDLDLGLPAIRAALDAAGPGQAHPIERTGIRASAVLAPFYEEEGETFLVFTRRAQHLRSHRGEVSFPGGGHDLDDADLWHTAVREAWEEIALPPESVTRIGELDHLTTVTSRSFIVPFVGVLPGRPELAANPQEVEAILHVPVRALFDVEAFHGERWGLPGLNRPVYFFEVPGDTIWGATAAMLVNLLAIISHTADRHVPGV
jgi:8-oxo-dGTP pyrophosphatase MutT (NUDIX family)